MAVDLPLNRYVEMVPDPDNHEMWQTIYKMGAFAIAIAYVVAAVAANIFLGLTNPTVAPFAALSAILALPYAVNIFTSWNASAQEQKALAFEEQQIALLLGVIPENNPMRNVDARKRYWSDRAEALQVEATNVRARHREDAPEGRTLHRRDQIEFLTIQQNLCVAKVRAAYFLHVLHNPNYAPDIAEATPLVCLDPELRMLERGFAAQFNEQVVDPFVLRPDGTPLLTLQQVLALPNPEATEQAIFGTELPAAAH